MRFGEAIEIDSGAPILTTLPLFGNRCCPGRWLPCIYQGVTGRIQPPLTHKYTDPRPATLVDVLRQRAEGDPDKLVFTFLTDGEREEDPVTYRQLELAAPRIAARLQAMASTGRIKPMRYIFFLLVFIYIPVSKAN